MSEETATEKPVEPAPILAGSVIDRANKAAEHIEKANTELSALLTRQEALVVERTLAGHAVVENKKKGEETPQEYARRVMSNDFEC